MSEIIKIRPQTAEHHLGIELEFHLKPGMPCRLPEEFATVARIDYENLGEPGAGYELTMCLPQASYKPTLAKILDYIRPRVAFRTDPHDYGLHVHLDLRGRDVAVAKSLVAAHYHVLAPRFVSRARSSWRGDYYFGRHHYYNTVELRLHEATFDYDKIVAYVDAHIAMISPADLPATTTTPAKSA